jgi:hypothetical protein
MKQGSRTSENAAQLSTAPLAGIRRLESLAVISAWIRERRIKLASLAAAERDARTRDPAQERP